MEATTGWRFVVEELRAVGAEPHLAEPAEASLKGNKKRAKTDRGDARHLRELLMAGRLPESYIAPEHLLDLRARVRLRHALVDQRGEWQQRIHAVLFHHGHPQKAGLLTCANREWLQALTLPDAAREQVTVALAMIDALNIQEAPITAELRRYARRQSGCRRQHAARDISVVVGVLSLIAAVIFNAIQVRDSARSNEQSSRALELQRRSTDFQTLMSVSSTLQGP